MSISSSSDTKSQASLDFSDISDVVTGKRKGHNLSAAELRDYDLQPIRESTIIHRPTKDLKKKLRFNLIVLLFPNLGTSIQKIVQKIINYEK